MVKKRPGSSASRRVSSQDVHAALEELVRASTEEASDEDGGEATGGEPRTYRSRRRPFSFTHGLLGPERTRRVRPE